MSIPNSPITYLLEPALGDENKSRKEIVPAMSWAEKFVVNITGADPAVAGVNAWVSVDREALVSGGLSILPQLFLLWLLRPWR